MTNVQSAAIQVTLLLSGGHSRRLTMSRDEPLLRSLLASIEDKSDGGNRIPRPYHLKLDEGRSSLIFSGRDLVGLITDPPLLAGERSLIVSASDAAAAPRLEKAH